MDGFCSEAYICIDGLQLEPALPAKKRLEACRKLASATVQLLKASLRCPAVQPAWHLVRACAGAAMDYDSALFCALFGGDEDAAVPSRSAASGADGVRYEQSSSKPGVCRGCYECTHKCVPKCPCRYRYGEQTPCRHLDSGLLGTLQLCWP